MNWLGKVVDIILPLTKREIGYAQRVEALLQESIKNTPKNSSEIRILYSPEWMVARNYN